MQIKSVLRKELLAARKLVSEEKRMELSFKTAEALFSTDEFKRADTLAFEPHFGWKGHVELDE